MPNDPLDFLFDPSKEEANATRALEGLNAPQAEAASWPKGSALIIAGAGSGKTKTLSRRVAWLLASQRARESQIMAVTFTNKAAKELVSRIGAIAPVDNRRMWVGTFHGLCARFLRQFHDSAQLPSSFQILDTQDALGVLKRLFKEKQWNDELISPKEVLRVIQGAKDEGLRHKQWLASRQKPISSDDRWIGQIFEAYEAQLAAEGAVDFPELLLRVIETLETRSDTLQWARDKFRHILVDEFQDTSPLQYKWVRLISDQGRSADVFAVGDDDQSIFGFRNAKVENMFAFERDFNVSRVVRLEQNYRSTGNILKAANALIERNEGRMGKTLWTQESEGLQIGVNLFESEEDEARNLARAAQQRLDSGLPLSEMAILYRANAQSRAVEQALAQRGVPYKIYGGLRFFERQEIKNALSYLRLALNPDDEAALLRIANVPKRGIGPKMLEKALAVARADKISLLDALKKAKEGPKARVGIDNLAQTVATLANHLDHPLAELVQEMLDLSGLMAAQPTEKDGPDREENLRELVRAAAAFERETQDQEPTLHLFMERAALDGGERGNSEDVECVQLMTTHTSKGLEFEEVWVCGAEEGLFPHVNSLGDEKAIQEERRLMYVAITRAKHRLEFTLAGERWVNGTRRRAQASRFLREIPRELLRSGMPMPSHDACASPETRFAAERGASRATREATRPKGADFNALSRDGWKIGEAVSHGKFGNGTILGLKGAGEDLVLTIHFADHGVKQLAAQYAKLTKT